MPLKIWKAPLLRSESLEALCVAIGTPDSTTATTVFPNINDERSYPLVEGG